MGLNQEDVVGGIPVEAGLHVEIAAEGRQVLEVIVLLTTVAVPCLHTG